MARTEEEEVGGRRSEVGRSEGRISKGGSGSALYLVLKGIEGSSLEEEARGPRIFAFPAHRNLPPPDLPVTGIPS